MFELTFLGDIFPGDELFTKGYGIKSKTDECHIALWTKNIRDVVGETNYIIGNLESPLLDDKDATGETFYGSPMFVNVLKDSGINVLNIANNHIMEHGVEGFQQTIRTLHGKGLFTLGEFKNSVPEILTIQHEGTKICMAGFCDERVCNIGNPNCYASLEVAKVFDTLERMKALSPDIIIFTFHWGNEYIHIPSLEQRQLAYKLIDNGVNLIVGHHPHVIQPYERYKHGHIIYSLGNFCFDDVQSEHFGKGMFSKVSIHEHTICDVSFSGILVLDMAYGEELVRPMNQIEFEKDFKQISDKYERLCHLSDEGYQSVYEETLQREHTKERVRMRLNLAKKAFNLRHRHKSQLLNNIKKYIFH